MCDVEACIWRCGIIPAEISILIKKESDLGIRRVARLSWPGEFIVDYAATLYIVAMRDGGCS
jgi:hypothetical protein